VKDVLWFVLLGFGVIGAWTVTDWCRARLRERRWRSDAQLRREVHEGLGRLMLGQDE
jgi:hypothetical protein